jgi:hypothetical protein
VGYDISPLNSLFFKFKSKLPPLDYLVELYKWKKKCLYSLIAV